MPPSSKLPSNFGSTEQPLSTTSESTMKQTASTSRPRRSKKPLLIALGAILCICLAAGVTVFVLSNTTKQITQDAKTLQQQAADLAKQANNAATTSANSGDTDGAIAHYREALAQFQKAGDKAGEEGVKLQLQYYEMVKANEEKAQTTTTESDTP